MEFNWKKYDQNELKRIVDICPAGEYRLISPEELTGILSDDLINKYHSVFLSGSATSDGYVYYMANANRKDIPKQEIDQMPFGFICISGSPSGSGCLIQHGDYHNRTTKPPKEIWEKIIDSGSANYYMLSEMPSKISGKNSELKIDSQNAAFNILIEEIKTKITKS